MLSEISGRTAFNFNFNTSAAGDIVREIGETDDMEDVRGHVLWGESPRSPRMDPSGGSDANRMY